MGDKNRDPPDRLRYEARHGAVWADVALVIALWPTLDARLSAAPALRTPQPWADPMADPWLPGVRNSPSPAGRAVGRTLLGHFECGGCHHIDGTGTTRVLAPLPWGPWPGIAGPAPKTEATLVRWIGARAAQVTPARAVSMTADAQAVA
jgi:hypothetical protein